MRKLLLLAMILLFGTAHAAAAPSLLCRHVSAEAHAAAAASSDAQIAGEAHHEEAVAAAADKLAALSDRMATVMANGVLPQSATPVSAARRASARWPDDTAASLPNRGVAPLLQPPLI